MKQKNSTAFSKLIESLQDLDLSQQTTLEAATLEGLSDSGKFDIYQKSFDREMSGVSQAVAQELASAFTGVSLEDLGENGELSESMKAATIALAASQNPRAYAIATRKRGNGTADVSLEALSSGIGGDVVFDNTDYSAESFDENTLSGFAAQNVVFNFAASRQDDFAEAFFPTKTLAPSEGGLSVIVDKQEVLIAGTHDTTGAPANFSRKNLISAHADATILANPSTKLVPYARADNSSDAYLVDVARIANSALLIGDVSVDTRPLAIGTRLDLLGISQHPGLIDSGVLDKTDQIAAGMRLENVYVELFDGTATYYVVEFGVKNLMRSQFKKSAEGGGREVSLSFMTDSLVIAGTTTDIAGTSLNTAALAPFTTLNAGTLTATLEVSISGNCNLDDGNLIVNSSAIKVASVTDANGAVVDPAAVTAEFAALVPKVIGYTIDGRRSNSNWRTGGTLIDTNPHEETYAIIPGYPITVQSPPEDATAGSGRSVNAMITAARVRNSNDAVTTLINYSEQLAAVSALLTKGIEADVIGAGRHIVTPFYVNGSLDVDAAVTSISSHQRAADISHAIIMTIRDKAYEMFRESNYGPAMEAVNGGMGGKPTLLIGTDDTIARYLTLSGDNRLMGDKMDVKVVSTNDSRLTGKIFLSFTNNRPGVVDGLTFGVHAYIPELIQRLNVARNNATARNDRVVPRSIHVPVLPVLAEIDVTNLAIAANNSALT